MKVCEIRHTIPREHHLIHFTSIHRRTTRHHLDLEVEGVIDRRLMDRTNLSRTCFGLTTHVIKTFRPAMVSYFMWLTIDLNFQTNK